MSVVDPPPESGDNPIPALGASDHQVLRWLSRANGKDIDPVQGHFNRAQAQVLLQRWADALASLEVVIAMCPEHAPAHEMRLWILARTEEQAPTGGSSPGRPEPDR